MKPISFEQSKNCSLFRLQLYLCTFLSSQSTFSQRNPSGKTRFPEDWIGTKNLNDGRVVESR